MIELYCDHCGNPAIQVRRTYFIDGEGDACMSCGQPGSVSISDDEDADDDGLYLAYWSAYDEPCTDVTCEECNDNTGEASDVVHLSLARRYRDEAT